VGHSRPVTGLLCLYLSVELHVTLLALRFLRWLLDFWNICVPLAYIRGLCVK